MLGFGVFRVSVVDFVGKFSNLVVLFVSVFFLCRLVLRSFFLV